MPRTIHAFSDDALGDDDVTGLLARLANREVSSSELVEASIERAAVVEPDLAAIASENFDAARRSASTHPGGPFAGLPTLIKDMVHLEGHATRWGSGAFHAVRPATKNDPFVDQMLDLGMVPIAKTTMPEFGFTPSTEFPDAPPTRNPWNLDRSIGGSSGGSAAFVAAGVVPIAHAADGGGSIRIPAACGGLVGLKPSVGRLTDSANTAHQLVDIVVDGMVTRSVRDTAFYFAQAERRYLHPKLPPIGTVDRPLERPLRIAVIDHSPAPGDIDAAVRAGLDDTVALLESLGHRLEPIAPPVGEQFVDDFVGLYQLLAFGALRGGKVAFDRDFDRGGAAEFTEGLGAAFGNQFHKVPGIVRRLRASRRQMATDLAAYDVILSPTVAQLPPPLGHLGMDLDYDTLFPRVMEWAQFTPMANATGAPAISLPLAHDAVTNLPVGMMFNGHFGDERLLLELALQLESAAPWPTMASAVAASAAATS